MATSLILHKRINTTVAKAKALKSYVEPLITKSKVDSTHSRRVVFSYLQNKESVSELFRDVAVKVASRPGGYTRILKTGTRLGDNAEMCIIELVDYNENYTQSKEAAKKTSTRRKRGSKKSTAKVETIAEEVKNTVDTVETPEVEVKAEEVPVAEKDVNVETVTEEVIEEATEEAKKEDKKEE